MCLHFTPPPPLQWMKNRCCIQELIHTTHMRGRSDSRNHFFPGMTELCGMTHLTVATHPFYIYVPSSEQSLWQSWQKFS